MEPSMSISRRKIEERYGLIGTGSKVLFLNGVPMSLKKVSRRLMLLYEDLIPIDGGTLPDGRYWIRYYEGEQRKVVVIEFDREFDIVGENGADILDWLGDDYFRIHWRVFCPAGGEEWLGADMSKSKKGG
ncbi:MAG TPA: hypothetical protein VFU42_03090 [Candidatus Deferrimicrobiaceae bacterium]|nr:hypothetical protein [Candidatus Deferrimicrobiaceae bacterium]